MLIITLGDPLSVSSECLGKLANIWQRIDAGPVILVGSWRQWVGQQKELGFPLASFRAMKDWKDSPEKGLGFYDIGRDDDPESPRQLSEADRGRLAVRALDVLRSLPVQKGKIAVLTAPIDKHICSLAGFRYPGQTEFFQDLWKSDGIMILAGPRLRVALATNHLRLADVSARISNDLLCKKIQQLDHSLRTIFGIEKPKIGVAALNPHGGDRGLFGNEDERIIAPAVNAMKSKGLNVTGPKPADTVFFRAMEGDFDAVLAMYHDQGLGPLKTVHFYDAINVTGGLPQLRLSPDHGPASELYGLDLARPDSFREALKRAINYLGW